VDSDCPVATGCLNGGSCFNGSCCCPAAYTGKRVLLSNITQPLNDYLQGRLCDTLISSCAVNPCQNNGLCIPTSTGYQCQCSASYTGALCQTPLNPCSYLPCQNGGQCNPTANNSFYCTCPAGIFKQKENER
jgi:hypothetical protein